MNQFWRIASCLVLLLFSTLVTGQIRSFPYDQDFESLFVQGESVEFLPGWVGNTVASSNRIFQGSDARSGSSALAIQTISSFDGQIDISLDLTDFQDASISFFAKSNTNGSGDRSALLFFATSIDGGVTFSEFSQIGTNTSFPNVAGETYTEYQYVLDAISDNQSKVTVRIIVERNESAGLSGSAAELLIDDFAISASPFMDQTPPNILAVDVLSENVLHVIFSEPVVSAGINDFHVSGDVTVIEVNELFDADRLELITSPLQNGSDYTLIVSHVTDIVGNEIQPNTAIEFSYLVLGNLEVGDIVINEFLADPTPVLGLPDAEFVELWNISDKFLKLEGMELDGNLITPNILGPGDYLLVVEDNDAPFFSAFANVATVEALTLSNAGDVISLQSMPGEVIDEVSYEGSTGGITMELINPFAPCRNEESFQLSVNPNGGTPGMQNSIFDPIADTVPPFVIHNMYSDGLFIEFSKPIDASTVHFEDFVSTLAISEVITGSSYPKQIEVRFAELPNEGQVYEISFSGVRDCSANEMEATTISFGIGRVPQFNELIITEIYFDETPSFGLPDREYIELHNASGSVLSLSGVELSDATSSVFLTDQVIFPNEYLIVSSANAAREFEAKVLELVGFPALNNSGELLSLSYHNSPIFSIQYTPDWHDELKADGGYSLEMVDMLNPCIESGANWQSSQAVAGGTPGSINSVDAPGSVPDSFGPELKRVYAVNKDSVIVALSEKYDPLSLSAATFFIEPYVPVSSVVPYGSSGREIWIVLADSLRIARIYLLQVEGIQDCTGNEMEEQEVSFGLPVAPSVGQILLSEILFNPRVGGVDFVELYNPTANFLTLSGWQLARLSQDDLDDIAELTDPALIISPFDFVVFTEDAQQLLKDYPQGDASKFIELNNLPSFPNDTGNVLLINSMGEIQEHLFYDEDYHNALLEDVDGVSLERVSFQVETQLPDNWRSAASTVGFATPGNVNSQNGTYQAPSGSVWVEPKVFIPGNTGSGRDFTLINYQFESPGKFGQASIYDHQGRKVKTLSNGSSLPTKGFFRWDGDTDGGSMARMGYYLVLFEVYDGNGNSQILKETVVVGRNF